MRKHRPTSLTVYLSRLADLAHKRLAYRWWWYAASAAFVLLTSAWYLLSPSHCARLGYPLDDAWIHQSYARTLAQTGQFAFAPGRPSTGSTSLMWTLLLTLGYLVRLPPVSWSYALGALTWFLAAWTAQSLIDRLFPKRQAMIPWVALACLFEWHLAWAALSGMEITLFCYLSLLLLERYAARAHPLTLGVLGGLLVWARPEGLVLAAFILFAELFAWGTALLQTARAEKPGPRSTRRATRIQRSWPLLLVVGLVASLAPYLALNLAISGQPFPSTLYAKQAEYRILLDQPIWRRLWVVVRRPLVGAQVLLLPGFVWQVYVVLRQALRSILPSQARTTQESGMPPTAAAKPALLCDREERQRPLAPSGSDPLRSVELAAAEGQRTPEAAARNDSVRGACSSPGTPPVLAALLPLAWWAAYHGLYALQLPVDYQHGRYLVPALPVLLAYGATGTVHWLRRATRGERGQRPTTRVWTRALAGALGGLYLAFLVLGAQTYVQDRCIIHQEMVEVALWLWENTPPDALIAAHDIGAIGYWAQRPLLDLAGLINPEVIPIMRQEDRLLEYVIGQQASYFVTFPSWYPALVRDGRLTRIYSAQGQATPPGHSDPMTVYRIER